ncbi:inactive serine protease PAMR1-like isoform X2 [Eucyclogobius newberryi]|uniref:inactive serine protease PAMR1-like isoform X2 n=1 Tax=Eucyclogobius newberryi TaxID=166745 RepID=UPI003B5C07D0
MRPRQMEDARGDAGRSASRAAVCGNGGWLLFLTFIFITSVRPGTAWPNDYWHMYNHCPGPEWSVMCRGCCEYDVIRCKCPLQGTQVGYAVPCCRNAINECDPCIIHPGCSIFENCKRCNNGTWGSRDDFFITGRYCAECRPGWSGGDCMKCGGVIRKKQGHVLLESYPNNARCEWTIQVDRPFTVELRFMMVSVESHHSCHYDYIEVRDGDSVRSRVIGRFCGSSRPPPIHSTGNSLHILFVSDGYKNFDGFFATFQETSACSSSPCLHDGTCILDSSYTYHCACLAGYTGKRCENVVGCHRPPVPIHGSTEGLFHHSGARITFRCDPGFELRGFRSAICLRDGTWSAPAPNCVPVERVCSLPPKPAHGDHFLVYGPNDVLVALQYLCHQPYELSGSSQRTCLPNNTWSGASPVCNTVNNTLSEAKKGKDFSKESEKGKEPDIYTDQDIPKVKEKGQENTSDDKSNGERNSTAVDREDKYSGKTQPGPDQTHGSPQPTGGTKTEIIVIKDKGQEEKEHKEEQVNGKKEREKPGPNDTKMRRVISEVENILEISDLEIINVTAGVKDSKVQNNTISADPVRKVLPTRINITQFTMYRGTGTEGSGKAKENKTGKDEKASAGKTAEERQKDRDREKNLSMDGDCPPLPRLYNGYQQVVSGAQPLTVEFRCNHSYALSGDDQRTCQADGTWTGTQPFCVRACREPKVSELVKQRTLPPQAPFRKTPIHKLLSRQLRSDGPLLSQLPPGFHHLYTHLEYECASQFYHHSGSSRRTCLKTGKWSGRHVSCSPVCGKHPAFDPERPGEAHWPWLAAIYRRSSIGSESLVSKADGQTGTPKKHGGSGSRDTEQASQWQLVCSAALVNQRTVVVAAHCVTELGKSYPLDPDKVKVVVGMHYRHDNRESKALQHLKVASIVVHPDYDPLILDSDLAVIKMLDKARIGEKVLPLCLSDGQDSEVTGGQGLVTGWSLIPDPSLGPEEKARVGLVHLTDVVPCEDQYARNGVPVSVTENMLCGSQKPDYGHSSICPSDTGGILVRPGLAQFQSDNKQAQGASSEPWRLVGLVSFGYDKDECDPDLYTVYTRVDSFKDWIQAHMK